MLRFQEIKRSYLEFERELMRQGKLPMWDTGIGFWHGSNCDEIFELFKRIKLGGYKDFLDLGSGDGRVVLIASLFTKATGIEIDRKLFEKAEEIKAGLSIKNVTFYNKNYYVHNISEHDIIFVSPDSPMHRGLETKLVGELKGMLIVNGPHFHPTLLIREKELWINDNFSAVYIKNYL